MQYKQSEQPCTVGILLQVINKERLQVPSTSSPVKFTAGWTVNPGLSCWMISFVPRSTSFRQNLHNTVLLVSYTGVLCTFPSVWQVKTKQLCAQRVQADPNGHRGPRGFLRLGQKDWYRCTNSRAPIQGI